MTKSSAKKTKSERRPHTCKWCKKGFTTERILSSHMCTKKKRFSEKDTLSFKYGLQIFRRFYELTTISKKDKTIEDFINSSYYTEFVKFGRHVLEISPMLPNIFIDFVINKGVKLSDWTKASVYDTYINEIVKKESANVALERTLLTMMSWAEEEGDVYTNFFNNVTVLEATHLINSSQISPWVLFLADSAENLFIRYTDEEFDQIAHIINPSEWKKKMERHKEDAKFVQATLQSAGL